MYMDIDFRGATPEDISDIDAIQREVYPPGLWECPDALLSIVQEGLSLVAWDGSVAVGYALLHTIADPLVPTPLDSLHLPRGDHLFIHDLCVLPGYMGLSIGKALANLSKDTKTNHLSISLVSLPAAVPFWEHHGFRPSPHQPPLPSYPEGSVLMFLDNTGEGLLGLLLGAGKVLDDGPQEAT